VHSNVFLSEQEQYEIARFLAQPNPVASNSDAFNEDDETAATVSTNLVVCRSLVQMMAGTIGLNTPQGDRGVETKYWFSATFSLPDQPTAIAPQIELSNLRLLIVSENTSTRKVLIQHAQRWHAEAEEVINSAMAMNALRRAANEGNPYQIAIIDMQMSVLNGAVLGKTILADTSLSDTKLVIACFPGQQQEQLRQQGFASVLTKPIKQLPLLHALVEAGAILQTVAKPNAAAIAPDQTNQTVAAPDITDTKDITDVPETQAVSDNDITESTIPIDPESKPTQPAKKQQLIDVDHLIRLCEGNEEVITKMLTQFIEDLPHSTTALQEAIAKQDFFTIQQNAHFIKGACATIGMHQVTRLAEQIEQEAKEQLTDKSNQLIGQIVNITTSLLTKQSKVMGEIKAKLDSVKLLPPLAKSPQSPQPELASNQPDHASTSNQEVNILVVDDDRMTLTLVTDSLEKLPNYKVTAVNNGKEAWQHLSTTVFDAIVSDWSMPDMSGIVLCQRIKFYPQLPSTATPFILLTAYSNSEYKKIARDAGVDDFLVKPVDPDALRSMVSFWVNEFNLSRDRNWEETNPI
jgi:CheY-like chemotaxis protein